MDILRAPWRMDYIDSSYDKESKQEKTGCIFCDYVADDNDEENLIIARGKYSYVIMNRYPYSVGHLLVAPYNHTSNFPSLSDDEKLEIFTFSQQGVLILQNIMKADGFNIGMNLGRTAGAGIDSHIHLHVVPRWNGDINFMSVTAETKVLPQALNVTHRKILNAWKI